MKIFNFRNKPVIVLIAQIFLGLNILSIGFLFIAMSFSIFQNGFEQGFQQEKISIPVKMLGENSHQTQQIIEIENKQIIVTPFNIGETEIELPFYFCLLTPPSYFTFFDLSCLNLLFMLAFTFTLFQIFRSISYSEPFAIKTLKQINIISIILIVWGIILLIRNAYLDYYLRDFSNNTFGFYTLFTTPSSLIQTGIVVFIIANVYKRGIAFQQDSTLTV